MAKFKFFSVSDADAEIKAADAIINPLLTAAKITSIEVKGEPLPATSDKVPLADKISALAAVSNGASGDQQLSDVLVSNQLIADQLKDANAKLAVAETNVSTLTREKAALEGKLNVANASVQTLTASNAELTNLRNASNSEAGRVCKENNDINASISRMCLEVGCLELTDAAGKAVKADADEETRMEAANRIPVPQKLTAFKGAVNAAMARTGLNVTTLPNAGAPQNPGAAPAKKEMTATERCAAEVAKTNRN